MKTWKVLVTSLFFVSSVAIAEEVLNITRDELNQIISNHEEWLRQYHKEDMDAFSPKVDSSLRANLNGANLSIYKLEKVNLSRASLIRANLSNVNLSNANLSHAYLAKANLSHSSLRAANLYHADLSEADLTEAYLVAANLTRAYLLDTNLENASLHHANLSGVVFEPSILPEPQSIASAKNLSEMEYWKNPQALILLKKAFREVGYRQQERAVTYAINNHQPDKELTLSGIIEDTFKFIFLNLPTAWGMYPGRALKILLILIWVFSIPYIVVLHRSGKSGIYRDWNKNHLVSPSKLTEKNETERLRYSFFKAVFVGFYFSILSAFNIGFREINIGNWITRIQPNDYTFYAVGWVRSVSGIQSLISVYLVAMWVLTYFGRPFG